MTLFDAAFYLMQTTHARCFAVETKISTDE